MRLPLLLLTGLLALGGWVMPIEAATDPLAEKIQRERKRLEALKDKIEEKRKREAVGLAAPVVRDYVQPTAPPAA